MTFSSARRSAVALAMLGLVLSACSSAEDTSDESDDEISASGTDDKGTACLAFGAGDELTVTAKAAADKDYIISLTFAAGGECKADIKTPREFYSVLSTCTLDGCGLTIGRIATFRLAPKGGAIRFSPVASRTPALQSTGEPVNFGSFVMKLNKQTSNQSAVDTPGHECTDDSQCSAPSGSLSECAPLLPVCDNGRCICD